MLYKTIDNFIDQNNVNYIRNKYPLQGMKYGWKANHSVDPHGHWNYRPDERSTLIVKHLPYDISKLSYYRDIYSDLFDIWENIKPHLPDGDNTGVNRIYFNGYTYGTDGYIHRDDPWITRQYCEPSETCMVYLNTKWNYQWGGETVLINDDTKDIDHSVLPKCGRLIIFDSNALHGARPLSRKCNDLRLVLVLKTIRNNINHPAIKYMIQNEFDSKMHSNISWFQYFYSITDEVMKQIELTSSQTNAILYHKIYQMSFLTTNRDEIRNVIGDKAEDIVWRYTEFQKADQRLDQTHPLFVDAANNRDLTTIQNDIDLMMIEFARLLREAPESNNLHILKNKLEEYIT